MGSSSEAFILAIQIHSPFISTHTPPPLITYISSVVNLSIIFVFKIFSKVKKADIFTSRISRKTNYYVNKYKFKNNYLKLQ